VYEKTVRRRRVVLALLVALSLILLTVYFGEAPGGRLHSVQRGFLTVVSPVQDGANKALKPVRDLFGWFGDTLHAKGQRDALRKQNNILRQQLVAAQTTARQAGQTAGLQHFDSALHLADFSPVSAQIVARSPTLWYSTVEIAKGTNAGIHVDDPVINGEGLVGKITDVTSDGAVITLITDQTSGVAASVSGTGYQGIIQPKVGDPNDLLLQYLPTSANVQVGQYIVTAGTVSSQDPSLFPPGIPIGQVTSVNSADIYKTVDVRPVANLRQVDLVQVLTRGVGGANRVAAALSGLPPAGAEPTAPGSGPPKSQRASSGTGRP
jgi:rod shape-determining protein MreC